MDERASAADILEDFLSSERRAVTGWALDDVYKERDSQDKKWGEQNHPNGGGSPLHLILATHARARCETAAKAGSLTWADILGEEFGEALAESDPVLLRAELVHVAAVAVAWMEAIDRQLERKALEHLETE
jgi:hypothetical protein